MLKAFERRECFCDANWVINIIDNITELDLRGMTGDQLSQCDVIKSLNKYKSKNKELHIVRGVCVAPKDNSFFRSDIKYFENI